jgi:ribonuclease HI
MFMFPNEEQRKNTYCVQFKNYFVNWNNISWLQNGTSICTVKSIKDILLYFIQFRNTFYTWATGHLTKQRVSQLITKYH